MGKKNDLLSEYFRRDSVMADLYNGILYHGEQKILPQNLADAQKTYHEPLHSRRGTKRKVRRERDAVRLFCRGKICVLLTVENQDKIDYRMPLRCAEYDVEEYSRQLRRLKRRHRINQDLSTPAEYLSGLCRTDRLIPVVTILLFHGEGEWDGPVQLRDMLHTEGMDETLLSLTGNYRLYIVNLSELEESVFRTGLRELVGLMKRRDDREAMEAYCTLPANGRGDL